MGVFKEETETKRVIFNVRLDLAERLEAAKEGARTLGRKLDVDNTVDKALERFLKKAEKKLQDMLDKDQERAEENQPVERGGKESASANVEEEAKPESPSDGDHGIDV